MNDRNILRWSNGPIQFLSPPDLSTTFVVCQACGWRADTGVVFLTLMDAMTIVRGHMSQHNGQVPPPMPQLRRG